MWSWSPALWTAVNILSVTCWCEASGRLQHPVASDFSEVSWRRLITTERKEEKTCFYLCSFWLKVKEKWTGCSAEGEWKLQSSSKTRRTQKKKIKSPAPKLPEASSSGNLSTFTMRYNDSYKYSAIVLSSCFMHPLHVEKICKQFGNNAFLDLAESRRPNEIQIWVMRGEA